MNKFVRIFVRIMVSSIVISVVIYFCIAIGLIIISGNPESREKTVSNLRFDELYIDYSKTPDLVHYSTRDNEKLGYRFYPSESENILILLHGAAWHSRYFYPLASFLSSTNSAKVYTPDLRGHGPNPVKRGDTDYINQLVDDLSDLIAFIKGEYPNKKIILGGHSSGGGLVLRYIENNLDNNIDAYLLFSPFLQYNAPTTKTNSGGFSRPDIKRIIGLVMLNNVGISLLNHLKVIDFVMPDEARDGTETLSYSYRLNTGYAPKNYKTALKFIDKSFLVIAGTDDESMNANEYKPVISQYTNVSVKLLNGVTHMGVVLVPDVQVMVKEWLMSL